MTTPVFSVNCSRISGWFQAQTRKSCHAIVLMSSMVIAPASRSAFEQLAHQVIAHDARGQALHASQGLLTDLIGIPRDGRAVRSTALAQLCHEGVIAPDEISDDRLLLARISELDVVAHRGFLHRNDSAVIGMCSTRSSTASSGVDPVAHTS